MRARLGRRRLLAGGALATSALAAAVAIGAAGSGGERSAGAEEGSVATATTEIARHDLVESETADGTLGYADERTVMGTLSGTVTWLPAVGSTVKTGQRLYQVGDENVYLLDGAVPVWRTLEPGLSGTDVLQLERSLRALGHDPSGMTVDRKWDSATTAAVASWQESNDLDATGTIVLGRVVFQPGERRVSETSVTLGGSSSGGTGQDSGTDGTEGASVSPAVEGARTAFVNYTAAAEAEEPTTTTELPAEEQHDEQPEEDEPTGAEDGADVQPRSGADPAAAADADASDAPSGDGVEASASPVMTTTSTRRIVTVELATSDAELARKGLKVGVELPSGDDVDGKITSVGRVATLPEGEDAQAADATVTVEIALGKRGDRGALDQAPVDVEFERSRRKDVLAIPVTALMARSGGRFAVEVREGGERRVVPVETGLYASGYVEIEGAGVREGMSVTNAEI